MTGGRAEDLRTALEHAFAAARWQVRDLTDDEYLWEPAEVCWSVRRRDPGVAGEGAGDRVSEWRLVDAGRPVPVTTIAWRLVHLAGWTDVYRDWTFGEAMLSWDAIVVPGDVASAVAWLGRAQDAFTAEVAALDDADLDEVRPTHWGAALPVGTLAWSIGTEHLHHGAEIGVLRDLRRGSARSDWWPDIEAARSGRDR